MQTRQYTSETRGQMSGSNVSFPEVRGSCYQQVALYASREEVWCFRLQGMRG
jgi:hypothetical protein